MTHILMAFTASGELIAARPVLCRDDEALANETKAFTDGYVDLAMGDTFGFVTEDDRVTMEGLNDSETHETGV